MPYPEPMWKIGRYRFSILTANFLASTAQFPQLPIFSSAYGPQNSPLVSLESHLHEHLRLRPLHLILPSISLDIRLDLADEPKMTTLCTDNSITILSPQSFLLVFSTSQLAQNLELILVTHTLSKAPSPFTVTLPCLWRQKLLKFHNSNFLTRILDFIVLQQTSNLKNPGLLDS